MFRAGTAWAVCVCAAATLQAAPIRQVFDYSSSLVLNAPPAKRLRAEVSFDDARDQAPVMVLMHGINAGFDSVRQQADRLRDAGFFVIAPSLRGANGSDGQQDYGGLDAYDIVDAVERAKVQYSGKLDPGSISITGYSAGGGNVLSALTKFPDYFRLGASYFGIADYGYMYTTTDINSVRTAFNRGIGGPPAEDGMADRYLSRNSVLAAGNVLSELQLFHNGSEVTCLPEGNHLAFAATAVNGTPLAPTGPTIQVHVGGQGQYRDFDGDGLEGPGELQDWPHNYPTAHAQAAAEGWYVPRLIAGQVPQPVLPDQGRLTVAGYVVTEPFRLWLGHGADAAATLDYLLEPGYRRFDVSMLSSDPSITRILAVDTSGLGLSYSVMVNGELLGWFDNDGPVQFWSSGATERIELIGASGAAIPEPESWTLALVGLGTWLCRRSWRRIAC